MSRTTTNLRRSLLALLVAASSLAVFAGTAAPAGASTAADAPASYDIEFGATAQYLGTATVTRNAGDPEDTIVVEFRIPGGFDEAQLCVSNTEFTHRVSPGQCQYKIVASKGQEHGRFEVGVEAHVPVFLQLHVVQRNETAYAAWVDGDPFYGNIEVPPVVVVADPVECPEGMAPVEGETPRDTTGNGVADESCETILIPDPVECPEGMEPEDGELILDADGEPTNCTWIPVEADCPPGQVPVEGQTPMDTNDDGVADEGCEVPEDEAPVLPVVTCPDGSTPMTDRNDDGVIDDRDCRVTTVAPDGVVPTIPVTTPLAPVTPNAPTAPQQPAPEAPAPFAPVPSVDVLPTEDVVPTGVAPTVVTVDNAQVTEVLGDQVVAGSLPRTGAATPGLAAFGALLLAAGTVLTRMGRVTA